MIEGTRRLAGPLIQHSARARVLLDPALLMSTCSLNPAPPCLMPGGGNRSTLLKLCSLHFDALPGHARQRTTAVARPAIKRTSAPTLYYLKCYNQ